MKNVNNKSITELRCEAQQELIEVLRQRIKTIETAVLEGGQSVDILRYSLLKKNTDTRKGTAISKYPHLRIVK